MLTLSVRYNCKRKWRCKCANAEEKNTEWFLEGIIHECLSDDDVALRKSIEVEGLKKVGFYIDQEGPH